MHTHRTHTVLDACTSHTDPPSLVLTPPTCSSASGGLNLVVARGWFVSSFVRSFVRSFYPLTYILLLTDFLTHETRAALFRAHAAHGHGTRLQWQRDTRGTGDAALSKRAGRLKAPFWERHSSNSSPLPASHSWS